MIFLRPTEGFLEQVRFLHSYSALKVSYTKLGDPLIDSFPGFQMQEFSVMFDFSQ